MVRWRKLQRISEELVKRPLFIGGATKGISYDAVVGFNDSAVSILINLNVVKTEERTIDVVSHELAHVMMNSETHGNEFEQKWDEIKEYLTLKLDASDIN